jgi:hypothetical protein
MSTDLIIKLALLPIVLVIYLYFLIVVLFNVWYIKVIRRYQWGIFLTTVFIHPAGYWWYRWAKKKYGSRKKGPKKQ